ESRSGWLRSRCSTSSSDLYSIGGHRFVRASWSDPCTTSWSDPCTTRCTRRRLRWSWFSPRRLTPPSSSTRPAGTSSAATASTPPISGSGFPTHTHILPRRHLRPRRKSALTRGRGSEERAPLRSVGPGEHVSKWSTIRPLRRAGRLEAGKEERTMPYDLVIRNGMVIDGSGLPRFPADIGVRHGRITAIGRIRERAREVIDADGQAGTPGFVDGHTHMDAQIFWDPLGTCSCWHGVTTVVMGNCGFTLAPCGKSERHLVVRNLERAEDIAAEAMDAGIEWTWTTFPEFLDRVDALPKGINYACYVGHSALRTYVMGERAFETAATED